MSDQMKSDPGQVYRPSREAVAAEVQRMQQQRQRRNLIFRTTGQVLFLVLAIVFLNLYVLRLAMVSGESMIPTLQDGDILLCSPIGFTPKRGDVVVSRLYVERGKLIKRVIGLPGDVIDIDADTGTVLVNGQPLDEPYIHGAVTAAHDLTYPMTVPEEHLFLLGDNRGNSKDSRSSGVGMVPTATLLGSVRLRIWPLSKIGRVS